MYMQTSQGLGQIRFPESETPLAAPARPLTEREVMLVAKSAGDLWGDKLGNIDVFAQRAIVRLSKNPLTAVDAHALLDALKSRALRGIFIENQKVPALRAQRSGTWYGKLIPPGEDAVLVEAPAGSPEPPLIAFRDSVKTNPARLDPALVRVWRGRSGCATCGGRNEPICGTARRWLPHERKLVLNFLDRRSLHPVFATIRDTLRESAQEHGAAIFRRNDGSFRLGETFSHPTDIGIVRIGRPLPCNKPHAREGEQCVARDEQWVGTIHTHPEPGVQPPRLCQGNILCPLCLSNSDVANARDLAATPPRTFTHKYVVGPSGVGPSFGVVVFEPQVRPPLGRITTLIPLP